MRTTYFIVIAGLLVVLGLLLYPTIHYVNGLVDTTGWLPLTAAAKTVLPYMFLGFVIYAIIHMRGGGK